MESAGWGAYAEAERQAADVVHIFQELPPEVMVSSVIARAVLRKKGYIWRRRGGAPTLRRSAKPRHARLPGAAFWARSPGLSALRLALFPLVYRRQSYILG